MPPKISALAPAVVALVALLTLGGCEDLSRFSTAEGESYCGSITLATQFRTGLSPRVQMRLTLDASALDGTASPGTLSTFEAADGDVPERRLFTNKPLRLLPATLNDPISRLEFGEGRDRNLMYTVSPDDPAGESVLAVVSLRSDDTAEVRLIRGGTEAVETPPPPGRRQIFGLFPLQREKGACGF